MTAMHLVRWFLVADAEGMQDVGVVNDDAKDFAMLSNVIHLRSLRGLPLAKGYIEQEIRDGACDETMAFYWEEHEEWHLCYSDNGGMTPNHGEPEAVMIVLPITPLEEESQP